MAFEWALNNEKIGTHETIVAQMHRKYTLLLKDKDT